MSDNDFSVRPLRDPAISQKLKDSWDEYKSKWIAKDGRPLGKPDFDADNPERSDLDKDGVTKNERVTYSEAVSYVLLRAAIMNDKEAFNNTWKWAQANLQRKNIKEVYNIDDKTWWKKGLFDKAAGVWNNLTMNYLHIGNNMWKNDNLFAWRYMPGLTAKEGAFEKFARQHGIEIPFASYLFGERTKTGAVLTDYSIDPAADADQDIAAALLIAYKNWGTSDKIDYFKEASAILGDIWNYETQLVNGERILLGGDTQIYTRNPQNGQKTFGVNPSYFRPYYYQELFKEYDKKHDWTTLVGPSYEILEKAQKAVMHDEKGRKITGGKDINGNPVNIVPEWIAVDNAMNVVDHGWKKRDWTGQDYYAGGDAARTHFWMALQTQLNPSDNFAKRYMGFDDGQPNISPYDFFKKELTKDLEKKKVYSPLYEGYKIDGRGHWKREAMYTDAIYKSFMWTAKFFGKEDLSDKVDAGVSYANGSWSLKGMPAEYYDLNWEWFDMALRNGELADALRFDSGKAKKVSEGFMSAINNYMPERKRVVQKTLAEKLQTGWKHYIAANESLVNLADFNKGNNDLDEAEDAVKKVIDQKWAMYTRNVPFFDEAVFELATIKISKARMISLGKRAEEVSDKDDEPNSNPKELEVDTSVSDTDTREKMKDELTEALAQLYRVLVGKGYSAYNKASADYVSADLTGKAKILPDLIHKAAVNKQSTLRSWERGLRERYNREILRVAAYAVKVGIREDDMKFISAPQMKAAYEGVAGKYAFDQKIKEVLIQKMMEAAGDSANEEAITQQGEAIIAEDLDKATGVSVIKEAISKDQNIRDLVKAYVVGRNKDGIYDEKLTTEDEINNAVQNELDTIIQGGNTLGALKKILLEGGKYAADMQGKIDRAVRFAREYAIVRQTLLNDSVIMDNISKLDLLNALKSVNVGVAIDKLLQKSMDKEDYNNLDKDFISTANKYQELRDWIKSDAFTKDTLSKDNIEDVLFLDIFADRKEPDTYKALTAENKEAERQVAGPVYLIREGLLKETHISGQADSLINGVLLKAKEKRALVDVVRDDSRVSSYIPKNEFDEICDNSAAFSKSGLLRDTFLFLEASVDYAKYLKNASLESKQNALNRQDATDVISKALGYIKLYSQREFNMNDAQVTMTGTDQMSSLDWGSVKFDLGYEHLIGSKPFDIEFLDMYEARLYFELATMFSTNADYTTADKYHLLADRIKDKKRAQADIGELSEATYKHIEEYITDTVK
jgi:endo-1,4-beta-D-glucanase Y